MHRRAGTGYSPPGSPGRSGLIAGILRPSPVSHRTRPDEPARPQVQINCIRRPPWWEASQRTDRLFSELGNHLRPDPDHSNKERKRDQRGGFFNEHFQHIRLLWNI